MLRNVNKEEMKTAMMRDLFAPRLALLFDALVPAAHASAMRKVTVGVIFRSQKFVKSLLINHIYSQGVRKNFVTYRWSRVSGTRCLTSD